MTIDLLPSLGFKAIDDELFINTQSGSQWDSVKHFAHQATGKYYNGLKHEEATKNTTNGIHNWCERGGIVGRGVLVDWLRWYEHKHGNPPSPVTRRPITVEEIEETLKWQGTTTRVGDIIMIRSGYVRWHKYGPTSLPTSRHMSVHSDSNASASERKNGTQENSIAIGLD